MKKYIDLIQGTEEWKEFRYGKIGGTSAEKLATKLDKSPLENAFFYKVLAERMEDFDPFKDDFKNYSMQRGNEMEPLARTEYERVYGCNVIQCGWIDSNIENIGISPDGLVSDVKSIEIKCPEAQTHANYMINPNAFLEDYTWQIVHNFLVIDGLIDMDCISYRPENKIKPMVVIPINLDTQIKISAKETKSISELKEILRNRLLQVENEIKNQLELLTQTEF